MSKHVISVVASFRATPSRDRELAMLAVVAVLLVLMLPI